MKLPRYEYSTEGQAELFQFTSEGPNGTIKKVVIYSEMLENNIYNLALGDYNEEKGMIDDSVITNNNDSQKVLATVASTLYIFQTNIQMSGCMQQGIVQREQDFIE